MKAWLKRWCRLVNANNTSDTSDEMTALYAKLDELTAEIASLRRELYEKTLELSADGYDVDNERHALRP